MKKNQLEMLFYSAAGIAAVFVILVAFNFISGLFKQRIDLTQEKAYTLSEGTRAILTGLDTPVILRLYYSQSLPSMPVVLKNYGKQVEDVLNEYKQIAKGNVRIEKLDPKPDTDEEDSANLDGIEGQMLPSGERLYLGIVVDNQLGEKVALPFLPPDRERLLEYDLSRAITQVNNPEKPTVGIMTPLQVFGQPANPMMMRQGQRGQDPWAFVSELKRDFNVRQVLMTVDKIDSDIKVLVVVHPKDITEGTQYAIDQFIMRGGKLIAFLDPFCFFDSQGQNVFSGGGPSNSTLDRLLSAWGIDFNPGKVLADLTFGSRTTQGENPTVLSVNQQGANADDVLTSQITSLLIPFAGAFSGTPAEGLKKDVLLHSTANSQMADAFMAQISAQQLAKDFASENKEHALAIRLSGRFKTAFPDGKPTSSPSDSDDMPSIPAAHLAQTPADNAVILFADADMLHDQACLDMERMQQLAFFGRVVIPRGQNLSLVQSVVEQLSGDDNLIAVRSRATMSRPFTKVREIENRAQENFRTQIKQLQDSLAETQQRLNELQRQKDDNQRFILSPEQEKELEKFRKAEAETNKKLREVQKDLRREVDSLQTRLKWINIMAMPFVVTFSGIVLALVKRKRTAAK